MAPTSSSEGIRIVRDSADQYRLEKGTIGVSLDMRELRDLVHRAMDFVLDADDWPDARAGGAT